MYCTLVNKCRNFCVNIEHCIFDGMNNWSVICHGVYYNENSLIALLCFFLYRGVRQNINFFLHISKNLLSCHFKHFQNFFSILNHLNKDFTFSFIFVFYFLNSIRETYNNHVFFLKKKEQTIAY